MRLLIFLRWFDSIWFLIVLKRIMNNFTRIINLMNLKIWCFLLGIKFRNYQVIMKTLFNIIFIWIYWLFFILWLLDCLLSLNGGCNYFRFNIVDIFWDKLIDRYCSFKFIICFLLYQSINDIVIIVNVWNWYEILFNLDLILVGGICFKLNILILSKT